MIRKSWRRSRRSNPRCGGRCRPQVRRFGPAIRPIPSRLRIPLPGRSSGADGLSPGRYGRGRPVAGRRGHRAGRECGHDSRAGPETRRGRGDRDARSGRGPGRGDRDARSARGPGRGDRSADSGRGRGERAGTAAAPARRDPSSVGSGATAAAPARRDPSSVGSGATPLRSRPESAESSPSSDHGAAGTAGGRSAPGPQPPAGANGATPAADPAQVISPAPAAGRAPVSSPAPGAGATRVTRPVPHHQPRTHQAQPTSQRPRAPPLDRPGSTARHRPPVRHEPPAQPHHHQPSPGQRCAPGRARRAGDAGGPRSGGRPWLGGEREPR